MIDIVKFEKALEDEIKRLFGNVTPKTDDNVVVTLRMIRRVVKEYNESCNI